MMYESPKRRIDRVFIHCSASDNDTLSGGALVEAVRSWHTERGWSDVGYHFLIDKKGKVMSGRPLEKTPAAQRGHNTGTLAIMVHGLESFSEASLGALRGYCSQINEAHSGHISFHGHCEVSNKSCPVFDYRGLLNLDRFGRMP
jgi:hypothetical protein